VSELKYGRYLHHYETDSDGVCHFSNYFRIFEEAFLSALREIMTADFAPPSLDHSFAVTEAIARYYLPIKYGDFLNVNFLFAKVGGSFLVASASIFVNDALCAELSGKFVAIRKIDNRSSPLNLLLRNALKNHMKDQI